MKNKQIAIIGAGIGGLTAGALLSEKGYKVTIFEKEQLIGGRALTFNASDISIEEYRNILARFSMNIAFSEPAIDTIFSKKMLNGYRLDLGYHAIGGGVFSNVNNVLSDFEEHVDFLESYVGFVKKDGYNYPFLSRADKLKILPNILRLLFASEKTLKRLDSVPMEDTIKKYGKGKMKLILEVFSRSITTMNNLDKISTGEMIRAQRNLYKGSKPVGYPIGGMDSICKKFKEIIIKNGGTILFGKKVDKIIIEEGKAIGVTCGEEKILCDFVISNILVQDLFKIADEKQFPSDYVSYIKSLIGTGSLCAYYVLKDIPSNLVGKTFHFLERAAGVEGNDVVGMIDFMSSSQKSRLSSKKDFLIQSYIICTSDEAKNPKILKKLKDLMDQNLKYLIPDYKSNLKWAIYPAIWHLDGVAKTIDKNKPDIKTPVENLFLVGDCVKAPGIGFNCALNSGRILSELL
jgi:protoporphyrinogen oxidase